MTTKEQIAAFIATDFPQCDSIIEAVGDVNLFSEGDDHPVAHAVGTYSIPPVKNVD